MANTTTTKAYSLDEYMSEKEKELARAREAAKREADIGIAKLQKYLQPSARTAAQGYSQGLSETAMIALENSRQRAHAAADSAYTAGYNDLMAQYRTEKKAEQDGLYADVMGIIDGGEWNTVEELAKYLYGEDGKSGATAGLSEAQRAVIAQKYGRIAADPEQKNADEDGKIVQVEGAKLNGNGGFWFFGKKDYSNGDNFSVEIDDTKYRIESAGEVSAENGATKILSKAKASGVEENQVFGYNGTLYILHQGKLYEIKARKSSYNGSDTDKRNYDSLYSKFYG